MPLQLQEDEAHAASVCLELLASLSEANPGVDVLAAEDLAAQAS